MPEGRPKAAPAKGDPVSGVVAVAYRCEVCGEWHADMDAADEHQSLDAGCDSYEHIYIQVERGRRVA